MATWMAHIRIAEHLMQAHPALDNDAFLIGNIGPDCGVPNEDRSAFTPDKSITHWMPDGKTIDAASFLHQYKAAMQTEPFYIGYYCHLITDIEWGKLFRRKKQEPLHAEGFAQDKDFIWTIKKDWYGLDQLYVQSHPQSVFHTRFAHIKTFENTYFDYYAPHAFTRQIQHITNFYQSATVDTNYVYRYLSQDEMDTFVIETAALLKRGCLWTCSTCNEKPE